MKKKKGSDDDLSESSSESSFSSFTYIFSLPFSPTENGCLTPLECVVWLSKHLWHWIPPPFLKNSRVWLSCVRAKQNRRAFGLEALDQVGSLLMVSIRRLKYRFQFFALPYNFSDSFFVRLSVDEWRPLQFTLLIANLYVVLVEGGWGRGGMCQQLCAALRRRKGF